MNTAVKGKKKGCLLEISVGAPNVLVASMLTVVRREVSAAFTARRHYSSAGCLDVWPQEGVGNVTFDTNGPKVAARLQRLDPSTLDLNI